MPRKKRPIERDGFAVRDASLLVVACEDTYAVKQYFSRFRTRRVQFKVLPTDNGRSSPEAVLARLHAFEREEITEVGDEFWVCLDTDHWVQANHIQNLRVVLQQCRQAGYNVALCNPCFELWLLLHFADVDATAADSLTCERVISQLRQAAGGYTKAKSHQLQIGLNSIQEACQRAEAMDRNPDDVLPSYPVTRIYRIIDVLRSRDSIDLG